jgi:hypothetical protein
VFEIAEHCQSPDHVAAGRGALVADANGVEAVFERFATMIEREMYQSERCVGR